jgi:putative copper export protein
VSTFARKGDVNQIAQWLTKTSASHALRVHESWLIPGVQSIHIVGIAIILGSLLMIVLRVLGWAWTDQTLRQTTHRFGPWLVAALCLQLVTGLVLIIAEPVRELVNFSFWAKMVFVAIGTALTCTFLAAVPDDEQQGELLLHHTSVRSIAVAALVVFLCIVVLGRLIAYDHIWGSWSPARAGY